MSYQYTPQELIDLPFNLRRAQLYPTNPPLVEQAIEDQLAGQARPVLMPQKTMFTKWHTGLARRAHLSTALSALDAGAVFTEKVDALTGPIEADKGIFTPFQASRMLNRLPQPMDNFEFNPNPIARGLLDRPVAQAPGLDAFAAGAPTVEQRTLLSTALEGDMTPLGGLRGLGRLRRMDTELGRAPRWLRGLGRVGMGFGALGDPMDIMGEESFDPNASPIPLQQTSNLATPGSSSQVVTTVTSPTATAVTPRPARSSVALSKWGQTLYGLLGLVGAGAGIYHGWKRTHSTPWTVAWGVAGGIFPIFALPVMAVQGFGKKGR